LVKQFIELNCIQYNDIAILTLESPIVFTLAISPVCLPPMGSSDQYLNQIATAKGWGRTQEKGKNSDFLRHAVIRIISNSLCRKSYMDDDKIADHMLCTWLSGRDACQVSLSSNPRKLYTY
jgi:hypothetical protein